jgi:ABC-type Na+ transport system ATPase subunit NatA
MALNLELNDLLEIKFEARVEALREIMQLLEVEQKRTGLGFIQYKRIKELVGLDELQP